MCQVLGACVIAAVGIDRTGIVWPVNIPDVLWWRWCNTFLVLIGLIGRLVTRASACVCVCVCVCVEGLGSCGVSGQDK